MQNDVKISVITVCKNEVRTVERTIQSIVSQTYPHVEHVIVDGRSTDGTLDVLEKYSESCRIFSEADNGIYDAMNRGVDLSKGDFMLFLNAGDYLLHESVLEHCAKSIAGRLDHFDVFFGNLFYYTPVAGSGWIWRPMKRTRLSMFMECLPHPATFFSRQAFDKNGLFDTSFQIAGDYEWFVRGMEKNNIRYGYMDRLVTLFHEGGVSTKKSHHFIHEREKDRIKKMHYSQMDRMLFSIGVFIKKNIKFL